MEYTSELECEDAPEPPRDLLSEGLLDLWLKGLLCDFNLIGSDGVAVKAHRVVLTVSSNYFKALFTGPWNVNQTSVKIDLAHATVGVLSFCTRGLYISSESTLVSMLPRNLFVHAENLDLGYLEAALHILHFFDAMPTQQILERAITSTVKFRASEEEYTKRILPNLIPVWQIAVRTHSSVLQEKMERAASSRMSQILTGEERWHLQELSFDALQRIIRYGYSWHDIVKAVFFWALGKDRIGNVKDWFAEIFSDDPNGKGARPLMPKILSEVLEGFRVRELPLAQGDNLASLKVLLEEMRKFALDVGRPGCCHPSVRHPSTLMVFGGRTAEWLPILTAEKFNGTAWTDARRGESASAFVLGVDVPEGMLVIESLSQIPRIYNVIADEWTTPENVRLENRQHSAITRVNDHIYLTGGKLDAPNQASAEVLTFSLVYNWWWGTSLTVPRSCHAAAAIHGVLYVAGGQPQRQTYRSMEWMDPLGNSCWNRSSARLNDERKYLGMVAHEGRLIAVGGMTSERFRLDTVEAFDPRDPAGWSRLPSMSIARSSPGVVTLNGSVFAVGGTDANDLPLASAEVFDCAAGRWRSLPPLQTARTSHAIAVV